MPLVCFLDIEIDSSVLFYKNVYLKGNAMIILDNSLQAFYSREFSFREDLIITIIPICMKSFISHTRLIIILIKT